MTVCLALAACGLPRSAGFQTEVLAAANPFAPLPEDGELYGFAYYEVNRQTLPTIRARATPSDAPLPWPVAQDQPASLIIAPGDMVQLTIWDAEENSIFGGGGVTPLQAIEVDPSGRIFVPFIGELRVAGMSPTTARQLAAIRPISRPVLPGVVCSRSRSATTAALISFHRPADPTLRLKSRKYGLCAVAGPTGYHSTA